MAKKKQWYQVFQKFFYFFSCFLLLNVLYLAQYIVRTCLSIILVISYFYIDFKIDFKSIQYNSIKLFAILYHHHLRWRHLFFFSSQRVFELFYWPFFFFFLSFWFLFNGTYLLMFLMAYIMIRIWFLFKNSFYSHFHFQFKELLHESRCMLKNF